MEQKYSLCGNWPPLDFDPLEIKEQECADKYSRLFVAGHLLSLAARENLRERVSIYEEHLRWFYSAPQEFRSEHITEIEAFNRAYIDKKRLLEDLKS